MPEQPATTAARPVLDLWREARTYSDDPLAQNRRWHWLMIANGHLTDSVWQEALGHRILAAHGPGETCADCPCWHCGTTENDPDGDHSCPCPHHDNDCPWHKNPDGSAR